MNYTDSWTPITEGLPKTSGIYLVTLDYGEHGLGIITIWYNTLTGFKPWSPRFSADLITAWMPAPEPYKVEREVDA